MDFTRQTGILNMDSLSAKSVSLIGAGAVGSFTALTICKMGVTKIEVYDDDGVNEHNLPNQFYKVEDVDRFKTLALESIISEFTGVEMRTYLERYKKGMPLQEIVIVATDSMASRKMVWEEFKKQEGCKVLIEARMGGEVGMVYTIQKRETSSILGGDDKKFYEEMLYSDKEVTQPKCTERAIIYNVLMIASLIARSLKAIVNKEAIPREMVFGMKFINENSFMIRS